MGTGVGAKIPATECAWMQHGGCRLAPDDGLVVYWRQAIGREGRTGSCKYKLLPPPSSRYWVAERWGFPGRGFRVEICSAVLSSTEEVPSGSAERWWIPCRAW